MKKAALKNLEEVSVSLSEMARLKGEFDAQSAALEKEVSMIRRKYEERLLNLACDLDVGEKLVLSYLKKNKAEFDGPPRSVELPAGKIGWRLGQPHLKAKQKGNTWEKILAVLEGVGAETYLRRKVEVNKDALLEDAQKVGEHVLQPFGLKIAQDDKPFIELKEETTHVEKQ